VHYHFKCCIFHPTANEEWSEQPCETSASWLCNILNAHALLRAQPSRCASISKHFFFLLHYSRFRSVPYTMAIVLGAQRQWVFSWQWVANGLVLGSKWDRRQASVPATSAAGGTHTQRN
jgi:hypothetical protein